MSAGPSKPRGQRKSRRRSTADSCIRESKEYRDFLDSIMPLAKELNALHRQAKALGIFVHDRGLLECTGCDLAEDIDATGRLMAWRRNCDNDEIGVDCGLRFEELAENRFRCPVCGTELRAEML